MIAPIIVIDSHTAGEPTRVVLSGGPTLQAASLAQRRVELQTMHAAFRGRVLNEPRGGAHWVGALLCAPSDESCAAGVIFWNNTGVLQMCGHGIIGVAVTLAEQMKIGAGTHRIETPVGIVEVELQTPNRVQLRNVPAYRYAHAVQVLVEGQTVSGDIAWGGNWFFLCADHGQSLEISRADALTRFCQQIKAALHAQNICGARGEAIDHIELFGPPISPDADSRNFVLCPGDAYDRSPCGTGTSAKLACLYADGKLSAGQIWRQESILGTVFEGQIEIENEQLIPIISGEAFVTAHNTLLFDPNDPLRDGVA